MSDEPYTIDSIITITPIGKLFNEENSALQNTFLDSVNAQVLQSGEMIGNFVIKDQIRSGQSNFNVGIGWWLGLVLGIAKFSIGNPLTNYLLWDGVSLKMKGSIEVGTGAVINNSVYTFADLPANPMVVGFYSPSANA